MPDKDSSTPRVYLIRHGATSWSQSGRYTGITDIPLLPTGEQKVRETASHVFGPNLLIDPGNLARVYVSPRQRALRTLELLFETAGYEGGLPVATKVPEPSKEKDGDGSSEDSGPGGFKAGNGTDSNGNGRDRVEILGSGSVDVRVTEGIAEWGYGAYEGLLTHEIRSLRKSQGLDSGSDWNIWRDGCEGSGAEKPDQVTERVDGIISEIVELQGRYIKDAKEGKLEEGRRRDVLVVAHGHILRAFVRRWLGLKLDVNVEMMLEPGGVCGLSYAHGKVDERAVLVGMSFPSSSSGS